MTLSEKQKQEIINSGAEKLGYDAEVMRLALAETISYDEAERRLRDRAEPTTEWKQLLERPIPGAPGKLATIETRSDADGTHFRVRAEARWGGRIERETDDWDEALDLYDHPFGRPR